jgi:carbon-monoxide dehydrogenase medium subunit
MRRRGIMNQFRYVSPKTIEEALKILKEERVNACLAAGCSNLLPQIRGKKLSPKLLVDITNIGELKGISPKKGKICLGPLTTIAELVNSKLLFQEYPVLHQAAEQFADPVVRNNATIGGNLVTASPAADMAVPLLALDALIKIESTRQQREVRLKDFFLAPGRTVLREDEMITEIEFEPSNINKNGCYIKLGLRKAMAIAVASIGINLEVKENKIVQVRIAMASVAPTPIRLTATEEFLQDQEVNDELLEKAINKVREEVNPINDIRASDEYRRYVSGILFKRAFKKLT